MTKDNNKDVKVITKRETVRFSTKKSILIKGAVINLIGLIIVTAAIIVLICVLLNKDKKQVEVPAVEKQADIEQVYIVDEDEVNRQAEQLAAEMFESFKAEYTAKVDEEATEEAIQLAFEEFKNAYIAKVDEEATQAMAEQLAEQMLEEYKEQLVKETEAARIANVSTIKVYVYYKNESGSFYLSISGSLYDRLTYDVIYQELEKQGYFEEYKVERVENKNAVEVFVGEDYVSTRAIRLVRK